MRTALPLSLLGPARAEGAHGRTPDLEGGQYDIGDLKFIDEQGEKRADYENFEASKRDDKEAWRAFSDWENIAIYDEPNGKRIGTVPVFSTRLYIYKEDGPFVLVSEDQRGPASWWVRKTELVLWRRPMEDPITGIEDELRREYRESGSGRSRWTRTRRSTSWPLARLPRPPC